MNRRDLLRALALAPWFASGLTRTWVAERADSIIAAAFGKLPDTNAIRRVFAAGPPASVLIYVLTYGNLAEHPVQLREVGRLPGVAEASRHSMALASKRLQPACQQNKTIH